MAVVHAPDSEFAKEMARWEAHHTQYGPPGRPYTYQPFPTRMYKAARNEHGQSAIVDAATAHDTTEQRNLESRGFVVGGQQAALDALAAQEQEIAILAANRNYHDRRMSEQAQAEARAAEFEAGARHLAAIPETPIKRRGRRPKAESPVSA